MTNKTLVLLADKLTNIEIDCGQVACKLEGVSLEAICNQVTAQDVVESMPALNIVAALIDTYGVEIVKELVNECENGE